MSIFLLKSECMNTIACWESCHMILMFASSTTTCVGDDQCHTNLFYLRTWTYNHIHLFLIHLLWTFWHLQKQKWRLHLMIHTWIRWSNAYVLSHKHKSSFLTQILRFALLYKNWLSHGVGQQRLCIDVWCKCVSVCEMRMYVQMRMQACS